MMTIMMSMTMLMRIKYK